MNLKMKGPINIPIYEARIKSILNFLSFEKRA